MNNEQLNLMLTQYYEAKEAEREAAAIAKPLNEEIKSYMLQNKIMEIDESDIDYKVKLTKTEKINWIEPVLIDRLKSLGFTEAVKTKEYIDYSVLETLIYNKKIKTKTIDDCKTIKETLTLRVMEK